MTVWRICKAKYASTMWSGIGSRSVAGRWNSKGTIVVYASGSLSLAVAESLAHLDSADVLYGSFVKCSVRFPDAWVSSISTSNLPRRWRASPGPLSLRRLGDEWATAMKSPVLRVPSVVVPEEFNYLLNPSHPQFAKMKFGGIERFRFDRRLS